MFETAIFQPGTSFIKSKHSEGSKIQRNHEQSYKIPILGLCFTVFLIL